MSRKPEILDALWRESDLPLRELAKELEVGSDRDEEELWRELRDLVRAGVVKQKENSVERAWLYRLSAQGILDRPVQGILDWPVRGMDEEAGAEP